ncbi:MAG: transcriptional regulator [Marinilabiliales bacterium]|nr:transcriptional regulator [Marinilabiliales bacterium]
MDAKNQVLQVMQKEGIPLNAGKIAELANLERKVVDKAMAELKSADLIVSPRRCFWQAK